MFAEKIFYFASFFSCLFLAYFCGFRSKQFSGFASLNSWLAEYGSGSFGSMLFGWFMSIFWTLLSLTAWGGCIYTGYKIFQIYDAGELTQITNDYPLPDANKYKTPVYSPKSNAAQNSNDLIETSKDIIKP